MNEGNANKDQTKPKERDIMIRTARILIPRRTTRDPVPPPVIIGVPAGCREQRLPAGSVQARRLIKEGEAVRMSVAPSRGWDAGEREA